MNRKHSDSYVFPFRRTDSEDKLEEDYELQAWALELVADGNPGCGIKVGKKKSILINFLNQILKKVLLPSEKCSNIKVCACRQSVCQL